MLSESKNQTKSVEQFKKEIVSKVEELNRLLDGYRQIYKGMSVVFGQGNKTSMKRHEDATDLRVEFIESPLGVIW